MTPPAPDQARSMWERMVAGEPYLADDPDLVERRDRATGLLEVLNATPAWARDERRRLLAELLGSLGTGTEVRSPLYVDYGAQLSLGADCFVNVGLVALDVAPIVVGDDVQIGPNVQLLTATHPTEPVRRRAKWEAARPVSIGDNVWLGGGVVVLPGVTIGPDTVVGAGSVVVGDLPPGVVAVGNPARVVRRLDRAGG